MLQLMNTSTELELGVNIRIIMSTSNREYFVDGFTELFRELPKSKNDLSELMS